MSECPSRRRNPVSGAETAAMEQPVKSSSHEPFVSRQGMSKRPSATPPDSGNLLPRDGVWCWLTGSTIGQISESDSRHHPRDVAQLG